MDKEEKEQQQTPEQGPNNQNDESKNDTNTNDSSDQVNHNNDHRNKENTIQSDKLESRDESKDSTDTPEEEETDSQLDFVTAPEELDITARNLLYERGQELDGKGKSAPALRCFLRCLSGLGETTTFAHLPQCLRHVADIYYRQEEYEKAIQFVQAEKLYYETALVDTASIQQKLAEKHKSKVDSDSKGDSEADTTSEAADVIRANEYEGLAQMCLERKQPQLALEYQAKATKLKQQSLGEDHPLTKKSLDFFTIVYGEVGKQQYSESVQKLTVPTPTPGKPDDKDAATNNGDTSGLRQRKGKGPSREASEKNDSKNKKKMERSAVMSDEMRAAEIKEQEEWISRALLLVLFGLCVMVLVLVLVYLYCKMVPLSTSCASWKSELHYRYMRFKYWYYSMASNGKTYG